MKLALFALLYALPAAAGPAAKPFATGAFDPGPSAAWSSTLKAFSQWAIKSQRGAPDGGTNFVGLYTADAIMRPGASGTLTPLIAQLPSDPGFRLRMMNVAKLEPEAQQEVMKTYLAAREAARPAVEQAAAAELKTALEESQDHFTLDEIRARRGEFARLFSAMSEVEAVYGGATLTKLRERMHEKNNGLQQALVAALVAQGAGTWNTAGLDGVPADYKPAVAPAPSKYFQKLERAYQSMSAYVKRVGPRILALPGVRGVAPLANFLGNAAEPSIELDIIVDADVLRDEDKHMRLMERLDDIPGLPARQYQFSEYKPAKEPEILPQDLGLGMDPPSDDRVTFGAAVESAHKPPFMAAIKRQFDRIEDELSGQLDPSHIRIHVEASWRDAAGGLHFMGSITTTKKVPVNVLMTISADGRLFIEKRPETSLAN